MNDNLEEMKKQLDEISERTSYINSVLYTVHKVGTQYNFTSLLMAYEQIDMQNRSIQQLVERIKKQLLKE